MAGSLDVEALLKKLTNSEKVDLLAGTAEPPRCSG